MQRELSQKFHLKHLKRNEHRQKVEKRRGHFSPLSGTNRKPPSGKRIGKVFLPGTFAFWPAGCCSTPLARSINAL
jgi:hypothetical protein